MNKIIEEDISNILKLPIKWELFRNSTVLISGASGCLPGYLVETLLKLDERGFNIKVLALVRNKRKAKARFEYHVNNKKLIFIVQDVTLPVKYQGKIDYIIHAASQASPKFYQIDPVGTLASNTIGTYNLLQLAVQKKVNGFLYFSSGEVYGREDQERTTETDYGYLDPLDVRSCYAESKRVGETMCVSFLAQYKVPVKIIRPFHTFGPGIGLNDGRVFADFIANIVRNENIVLKSDGLSERSFCYLADATVAFFLVLLEGKIGEAYNVGREEPISIIKLAELVVGLFPKKKLKVISKKRVASDQYIESRFLHIAPDISKIKKLGWEPKYSVKEAFRRTILSFREQND